MHRFEIIIRQQRAGVMKMRTVEAIARTSIDALLSVVSAINPQGAFTAVVRPFEVNGGL